MDKMRSGITLLITLSVIATMIALMGVMFKYLDVARTKAEVKASLIQSSLIKNDMLKILKVKLKDKSSMKILFDTPIYFAATTGEFSFGLSCEPLANRLNIAWLSSSSNLKNEISQEIFQSITEIANMRSSSDLLESIRVELDSGAGIRFGEQGRLTEKKGIITFKKFQQLMDDYYYKNDDKNVYSVDWESYFSFGHNINRLDGDFITDELLALMYGEDIETVRSNSPADTLKDKLEALGVWEESANKRKHLFSKKSIISVQCKATYDFRDGGYGMRFNYLNYSNERNTTNVATSTNRNREIEKKQRIENFEFIGQ